MSDVLERAGRDVGVEVPAEAPATGLLAWVTSTDHKRIGVSYVVTAFAFFLVGGLLALIIRAELWEPDLQIVSSSRFAELFTMHGSVMLFLFLGPFAFGLANYFVPLQIGAHDMAFPRLNALSYWLYLWGGLVMISGFATAEGAADFGWFAYPPLALDRWSPTIGGELWLVGVLLTGFSGIFTAVNVITTVLTMRAPGMTMFRMPIFTWNMTVTSLLVLMAFPVVAAAAVLLFAERHVGLTVFDPLDGGSPLIWQHLFWFFGHPEVYILALPYFGVISEVVPTFSRRPIFGYVGVVLATFAIAALSMGVWAHHMFVTGAVVLPYFSLLSVLIAVPTGIKIFNWIGTMWGGRIRFTTSMLFAIGFIVSFTLGGISGVQLAIAPVDFQASDTYFVVAHFHYVLVGGSVMALFAGIYYWFPKVTGRLLSERLGKVHFVLNFIGVHATFLIQHQAGLNGMPRRVADYLPVDGLEWMNKLSSIGASLLGVSILVFLWNVWTSWRDGTPAGDDPWDGQTLEWATSSPPPADDFVRPLPPIRSSRPVFDAKYGTGADDEIEAEVQEAVRPEARPAEQPEGRS